MKDNNCNSYQFWYCKQCKEEVIPENVTFQELHDRCGHPVLWIELKKED